MDLGSVDREWERGDDRDPEVTGLGRLSFRKRVRDGEPKGRGSKELIYSDQKEVGWVYDEEGRAERRW